MTDDYNIELMNIHRHHITVNNWWLSKVEDQLSQIILDYKLIFNK